jgi:ribulose-phosphate 3-epimerase
LDIWVQVDGGITLDTIVEASENGADTFVAGSSVYGAENPEEAIAALRVAASHVH